MREEIRFGGCLHPSCETVVKAIMLNPDTKFWNVTASPVTRNQWRYWTKWLVRKGYVKAIEHGHNQYNRWTGYILKYPIFEIESKEGCIPF